MKKIRTLATAALAAASVTAHADWTIGSGPAAGMGRAGIALPGDPVNRGRLNPGLYGLASGFRFRAPRLSFRIEGIGLGELNDVRGDVDQGGIDIDQLADIARRFGDSDFEVGAGADLGLFFSGFVIDFNGDAFATGVPNPDLQAWVASGSAGTPPTSSRLDAYGVGAYEVGVGYGRRLNTPGNLDLSIGFRAKFVRSYYTHQFVDGTQIANNQPGTPAPEMNGQDVLDETGFGLDLGVVASADKSQGLFLGATLENLVVPQTTFQATHPDAAPGLSTVRPYRRSFNLGLGFTGPRGVDLALDWVDVFGGAGTQELRAGAEWRLAPGIALRSGYESRNGLAIGLGLGGFNLALGGNSTGVLRYALRF